MKCKEFDKQEAIRKIKNPLFARFLGGFISEGTLIPSGSIKITNKDLNFITEMTNCIANVFGKDMVGNNQPAAEHISDKTKFAYRKNFPNRLGRFLIKVVGLKPGKKILNDDSLPDIIMKWSRVRKEKDIFKEWLRNYIQARFSGDGWVGINKKWIGLTKVRALKLNKTIVSKLLKIYSKGKKIKDYPEYIIKTIKREAKKKSNFPTEFVQLKDFLYRFFSIDSRILPYGIRTIYWDERRKILIVSAIYALIISKRENIEKFAKEINFLEVDSKNRKRISQIISDIKKKESKS